jgi:hypothetical protein
MSLAPRNYTIHCSSTNSCVSPRTRTGNGSKRALSDPSDNSSGFFVISQLDLLLQNIKYAPRQELTYFK